MDELGREMKMEAEAVRNDRATAAYLADKDVAFDDWPADLKAFATGKGLTGCADAIPTLGSLGMACDTDLGAIGAAFAGMQAGALCKATCDAAAAEAAAAAQA